MKRYIGHNGTRRKVARLVNQFKKLDDCGHYGAWTKWDKLEPIVTQATITVLHIPQDDIIWKPVMDMWKRMDDLDWQGYVDDALRGTY